MFLRCERFRPEPAAERVVLHFRVKKMIFGCPEQKDESTNVSNTKQPKSYAGDDDEIHVFARPVLMSDLTDEDIAVLERGLQQVLPQRDAAGRIVLCVSNKSLVEQDFPSLVCELLTIRGEAPCVVEQFLFLLFNQFFFFNVEVHLPFFFFVTCICPPSSHCVSTKNSYVPSFTS